MQIGGCFTFRAALIYHTFSQFFIFSLWEERKIQTEKKSWLENCNYKCFATTLMITKDLVTIWNLLQDFTQIISTTSESRELLELIKGRYCSFLSNCDLIFEIWSFGKREKYKNQFNTTSICMRNFILIKILSETRIKVLRLSLKAFNFTKINTPPRVFFTFLKLYKWY